MYIIMYIFNWKVDRMGKKDKFNGLFMVYLLFLLFNWLVGWLFLFLGDIFDIENYILYIIILSDKDVVKFLLIVFLMFF